MVMHIFFIAGNVKNQNKKPHELDDPPLYTQSLN